MYQGVVIYSEELGVYLGACMGLGFWSKLDPVGQEFACTFESAEQATKVVGAWDSPVENLRYIHVETAEETYASVSEVETAGLPGWNPHADANAPRIRGSGELNLD